MAVQAAIEELRPLAAVADAEHHSGSEPRCCDDVASHWGLPPTLPQSYQGSSAQRQREQLQLLSPMLATLQLHLPSDSRPSRSRVQTQALCQHSREHRSTLLPS